MTMNGPTQLFTGASSTDRCSFPNINVALIGEQLHRALPTQTSGDCTRVAVYFLGAPTAAFKRSKEPGQLPNLIFDGQVVLQIRSHVLGYVQIGQAGFFGGSWLEEDTQPTHIGLGGSHYGAAVQWGPASFSLVSGTQMLVDQTAATSMLLTGGYSIDGSSTSFRWDPAGPAFVSGVAVTPANLDLYGALQNPNTGTRLYRRP